MIAEDKNRSSTELRGMSLSLKEEQGVEDRHHRGSVYHLFATLSQVEVN